MSNIQTMKTGVHEVSHALLHDREVMDVEGVLKDQTTKEVEAESIALLSATILVWILQNIRLPISPAGDNSLLHPLPHSSCGSVQEKYSAMPA